MNTISRLIALIMISIKLNNTNYNNNRFKNRNKRKFNSFNKYNNNNNNSDQNDTIRNNNNDQNSMFKIDDDYYKNKNDSKYYTNPIHDQISPSSFKYKPEFCSHCKKKGHSLERCWFAKTWRKKEPLNSNRM